MHRRKNTARRLALAAVAASVLWCLLGAPLSAAEWCAVPLRLARGLRQVPGYAVRVLRLWQGPAESAKAEEQVIVRVFDAEAGAIRRLPLEDYVAGVLACEMPASCEMAALEAQAVAARTLAAAGSREFAGTGCHTHPEADVCTDAACCQGWLSDAAQAARWGAGFEALHRRVCAAAAVTAEQVLVYDGLPISALYHACSGGMTEDAQAVFSAAVPYLQSVSSPGEESYARFEEEVRFTWEACAEALLSAFPDSGVDAASLPAQLELLTTSPSGRALTVRVGSSVVTGRALRAALSLQSTWLRITSTEEEIVFRTRGYGHGVGMSQAGAQAMALSGCTYAEILAHYYPGATLASLTDSPPFAGER